MKSRLTLLLVAAVVVTATTGCLSFQSYGSPTRGHTITEGASRADVLLNLGEPDSVYKSDDTEAFTYKGLRGANYFGVYNNFYRQDTVVVMDNTGKVMSVQTIDAGRGRSLLMPPIPDATYPIRSTELTESPENYDYEYKSGK
ncbi:hypothetical protein IT570_04550 [Candidatus Sumerlaeota bacterium]|nr:hypothetical protein [Candidatus Sumerlaeota bacterium]